MTRLLITRMLGSVCLAVMLIGLAQVYGDDPCYDTINESVICPSATAEYQGQFDTCQYQYDNGGGVNCEHWTYIARMTGPYGEQGTATETPCGSAQPTETGKKCIPLTDGQGVTVREECAVKYKCKTKSIGPPKVCETGDRVKGFKADKYTTTTSGCKAVE